MISTYITQGYNIHWYNGRITHITDVSGHYVLGSIGDFSHETLVLARQGSLTCNKLIYLSLLSPCEQTIEILQLATKYKDEEFKFVIMIHCWLNKTVLFTSDYMFDYRVCNISAPFGPYGAKTLDFHPQVWWEIITGNLGLVKQLALQRLKPETQNNFLKYKASIDDMYVANYITARPESAATEADLKWARETYPRCTKCLKQGNFATSGGVKGVYCSNHGFMDFNGKSTCETVDCGFQAAYQGKPRKSSEVQLNMVFDTSLVDKIIKEQIGENIKKALEDMNKAEILAHLKPEYRDYFRDNYSGADLEAAVAKYILDNRVGAESYRDSAVANTVKDYDWAKSVITRPPKILKQTTPIYVDFENSHYKHLVDAFAYNSMPYLVTRPKGEPIKPDWSVSNAKGLDGCLKANKDITAPKYTTVTTQITLKIPEGWVFVRVGKPKIGEWFLRLDSDGTKQPHKCDTEFVHSKIIVKKKEWEWPSKITPGEWIAMDAGGHWFYSSEEPLWVDGGWWCPVEKTCKFLIGWAKPDCKDITESKRQKPKTIKVSYGYACCTGL